MKIVSWNILAPELLMYFWRSSYGLEIGPIKPRRGSTAHWKYYDDINRKRIDRIINILIKQKADIICLQEVTSNKYHYLGDKSIQQYIADQLDFVVVGESFKQSPFKYNYPPNEQFMKYQVETGVATLVRVPQAKYCAQHQFSAEEFGPSPLFRSGIGSPFTVDSFCLNGDLLEPETRFYVVNLHIRMLYPHIRKSVDEVYERISQKLSKAQLQRTVTLGDFNASDLVAARELFSTDFHLSMFDLQGSELLDDHIFVGRQLLPDRPTVNYLEVPLLEMNVNIPTSQPSKYKKTDAEYKRSEHNNRLVDERTVTTDHYGVIVELQEPDRVGARGRARARALTPAELRLARAPGRR